MSRTFLISYRKVYIMCCNKQDYYSAIIIILCIHYGRRWFFKIYFYHYLWKHWCPVTLNPVQPLFTLILYPSSAPHSLHAYFYLTNFEVVVIVNTTVSPTRNMLRFSTTHATLIVIIILYIKKTTETKRSCKYWP